MTSNDLQTPHKTSNDPEVRTVESKNKLKGGGRIKRNDEFLDEIIHDSNI